MNRQDIEAAFGIKESFELPNRLMEILFSDEKKTVFDRLMESGENLDHDWFTTYFEEEHANKSKMAQDFTPKAVCDLLAGLVTEEANKIADVCCGTGGLTIGAWQRNKDAEFLCIEISQRAIPLLLLNLSIRNIKAKVIRMDVLTGEVFEFYQLKPTEKYSDIHKVESFSMGLVDAVISNPPYSMKYKPNPTDEYIRFGNFAGMLPSNFADYVFIAFGLAICRQGGRLGYILPHGVLFRSNKEALCRKKLISNNWLKGIIGIPDKLFINTDIPTCIVNIQKDSTDDGILVVDAKSECVKDKSKNIMQPEHVEKILQTVRERKDVERFAHFARIDEIERNDYNLNISRYVDTFIPEPLPDMKKIVENLCEINEEIEKTEKELVKSLKDMCGSAEDMEMVYKYMRYLQGERGGKA